MQAIADTIIGNLQFSITNVHIRYEVHTHLLFGGSYSFGACERLHLSQQVSSSAVIDMDATGAFEIMSTAPDIPSAPAPRNAHRPRCCRMM